MRARRWLSIVVLSCLAFVAQGAPPDFRPDAPDGARPARQAAPLAKVVLRQGGDTMATATPIDDLPYTGMGTTLGYADDHDIACPDGGSGAPDVVYSFTRPAYGTLTIDFCGSDFDTKISVLTESGQILDCNDDRVHAGDCAPQTSRIDNLWVPAGVTCYLIVDGAAGAEGDYQFTMRRWGGEDELEGDTVMDPIVVTTLPFTAAGTTEGFTNDYDEVCPYTGSTAPDVVYSYVAEFTGGLDVDLCGSAYDTKVYVYDAYLSLVACNDDAYFDDVCGMYVSAIINAPVVVGEQYYVVVDGYGEASGVYELLIEENEPCLDCVGHPEWEPPLVDDYEDAYNGGCNYDPDNPPLQWLEAYEGATTVCGVGGWYDYFGSLYRDTDWYEIVFGYTGTVEVTGVATANFIMGIVPDCEAGALDPYVTMNQCVDGSLTLSAGPTYFAMFFAAAADWSGNPGDTFEYVLHFTGLDWAVTTQEATWGAVKSLYRDPVK